MVNPSTGKNADYRQGPAVDASGELLDGRKFGNLDELMNLLTDRPDGLARDLVNHLVTRAAGAGVTFADRAAVGGIVRRVQPKSYGIRTLAHEIIQSPLFQNT